MEYIKKKPRKTNDGNNIGNIITNKKPTKTRKHKWEGKQLYGYFKCQIGEIAYEMSGRGLKRGKKTKGETESL